LPDEISNLRQGKLELHGHTNYNDHRLSCRTSSHATNAALPIPLETKNVDVAELVFNIIVLNVVLQ
jgi:hypothetical protein